MYLVDFHSFLPPKKQKTKLVTLTPTQRCNTIRCTNLCYEPFHPRVLLFAFQWRQSAEVVILFIQYSSRLLQHSSLSVWPLWWFVAHLKPHTCDLLVKVTTKPQHGWPSLLLSHWGLCRCVHQHALRCFEYIQKDVGGTRVYVLTYVELIPTVYTHTQLWLLPTDWSPLPETCAGPNPMFSLIEGMSAKTIRGSNNSLNHIGFLHTKHFPWEAVGIQMNTDVKCKQLSVPHKHEKQKSRQ